jgi:hypothetical protein
VQQRDFYIIVLFWPFGGLSVKKLHESFKPEFGKCKKNVTGKMPVTFSKVLFSIENISSEGFRIGLLISMPFEQVGNHCGRRTR